MEQGHLIALGTPAETAQRMTASHSLELEVAPESRERALSVIGAQDENPLE